jgi:spore maturation protein CgeB
MEIMQYGSIVIVGGEGGTNIGSIFKLIALGSKIDSILLANFKAYEASKLIRKINWYLNGRYPTRLKDFSKKVIDSCTQINAKYLLTTGIAPVSKHALQTINAMGVKRLNFLTDDPWNPAHRAPWFFKTLPHYDIVFSPRRAMINDLLNLGCRRVEYLPFGYDPDLFYPEPIDSVISTTSAPDIMFAGGADRDRIPYISTLIEAGFNVDLYGSYWERYPETKHFTKGQADVPTLRRAIQKAKIALCVVRHANRDGHCMRTFEVPAIGTCMLTEDTAEHREIFGKEGENVVYFTTLTEMVEKTQWLLEHDGERERLAQNAHLLITQGGHTYGDRLNTILAIADTI